MSALLTGDFYDPGAIRAAIAGEQAADNLKRRIRAGFARPDELCEQFSQFATDAMAASRPPAADPRFRAFARRIQARIEVAERDGHA